MIADSARQSGCAAPFIGICRSTPRTIARPSAAQSLIVSSRSDLRRESASGHFESEQGRISLSKADPTLLWEVPMLELRPNCEYCDKDLPPQATDAWICT